MLDKNNIQHKDIDLVLYHGSCPDGFCAAWAAWRRLGSQADYVPVYHHELPPDVSGCVVALVDFCYPRAVMEVLIEQADGVLVLDHHVSAMKSMEGCEGADIRFDMSHSGAMLSWQYFHPGKKPPYMIEAVEARDLWKPNWRQHGAYLTTLDSHGYHSFEDYESIANRIDNEALVEEGRSIERYRRMMVESHVKRAKRMRLIGREVMAVNCTSKELISDIGHQLCKETGIGLVWWMDHHNGQAVISLRSDGDVDVSEIAKRYGGGGHKNAAGFTMSPLTLFYPI